MNSSLSRSNEKCNENIYEKKFNLKKYPHQEIVLKNEL